MGKIERASMNFFGSLPKILSTQLVVYVAIKILLIPCIDISYKGSIDFISLSGFLRVKNWDGIVVQNFSVYQTIEIGRKAENY